ncbi:hypothetical protein R1flu_022346 [Riccia fluitans]|uniref:chitinase n=1 Tax=Riccia fluitans TaxID=41844 RepID=A0ABD1ZRY6_9MARC
MERRFAPWAIVMLLFAAASAEVSAGSLASYWGQSGNEGTLASACASGHYDILMLAFLNVFGNGKTPSLNLAGHCDPSSGQCRKLASEVQTCQKKKVKVILSLGGGSSGYGLKSSQDAKNVAHYLWKNFFGGSSASSPLGAVKLDGIDLDVEGGNGKSYYDDLITTLKSLAKNYGKKLYITAAPQCPFPDAHLGPGDHTALSAGVDMVFVQFYNNYCQYQGGLDQLVSTWKKWTRSLPHAKVFLGLPAAPGAAGNGYVAPKTLTKRILPKIKTASNYGGVMLWSVYWDRKNNYSAKIKGSV